MNNTEVIRLLKTKKGQPSTDYQLGEALQKAISALEKQEADRWHSVAIEGNPKESGVYNCTCSNGTPVKRVTTIKYFKRTNEWAMTGRRTFWKVIAWRPLPEPYTGEES